MVLLLTLDIWEDEAAAAATAAALQRFRAVADAAAQRSPLGAPDTTTAHTHFPFRLVALHEVDSKRGGSPEFGDYIDLAPRSGALAGLYTCCCPSRWSAGAASATSCCGLYWRALVRSRSMERQEAGLARLHHRGCLPTSARRRCLRRDRLLLCAAP